MKKSVSLILVILLVSSASAIDLNSTTSLRYFPDSNLEFEVGTGGDIDAKGEVNITDSATGTRIAGFKTNQIEMFQPLSIQSSGPLSVANGIDLTGTGTNTIDSYSTLYLQTSSGSPTDIVLQPTGVTDIDSNTTVRGNLNVDGNSITNYFDNACGANQAVKEIYDNGTLKCGQAGGGLPTVLDIDNTANDKNINDIGTLNSNGQQLDVGGDVDMNGNNVTDSTRGNVSIGKSLKIYGNIWIKGEGDGGGLTDAVQNLSEVLDQGNSAGSYDIDMNGNNLRDVGGVFDDSNTQCGPDEFLNGEGSCTTDSFAADTDNQNLQQVLTNGNSTGSYDINLNGNSIWTGGSQVEVKNSGGNDVIRFKDTGEVEIPNGKLDVNGNLLRDVGGIYDDSGVQCGSDEFLNGNGVCKTDSFAADTDNQNLQDVLAQGNSAGSYDINLTGQEIIDTSGSVTLGGGNVDIPDGNLDTSGNDVNLNGGNVTSSGGEICAGNQC